MAFVGRWLIALVVAFLLFPVAFVLWNGADADFGLLGGMVLMMFLQFSSPYDLWLIPLIGGTIAAFGWQVLVSWRASQQTG